jgi:predicted Zn-dependent protease
MISTFFKYALLGGFFIGFGAGCSSSGTGLNIYSYQQEENIGRQYSEQINKEMKIMQDPTLRNYINNLGHRMISQGIDDPHFEYQFAVVDSSEVNAFAIPGGFLYVNLALIKEAENEAELVGVVGHEIGHVVHRHGTKRMTDASLVQLAAGLAAKAGGQNQGAFYGLGVVLFGQAGMLKYGRNAELEADRTGVDILYRSGYSPRAMASFFNKLLQIEKSKGAERGGLTELLSTHPATADRVRLAEARAAELPARPTAVLNTPEFEKIKAYVAPMKPSAPTTKGKG